MTSASPSPSNHVNFISLYRDWTKWVHICLLLLCIVTLIESTMTFTMHRLEYYACVNNVYAYMFILTSVNGLTTWRNTRLCCWNLDASFRYYCCYFICYSSPYAYWVSADGKDIMCVLVLKHIFVTGMLFCCIHLHREYMDKVSYEKEFCVIIIYFILSIYKDELQFLAMQYIAIARKRI